MTQHIQTDNHIILGDGTLGTVNALAIDTAKVAGHSVGLLTYPGIGLSDSIPNVYELDLDNLKDANKYLMRANKSMHRSLPRQQMAQDNALRRDHWLVKWVHTVYITGVFTQDASLLKINTDVAWAAQMYIDRFIYDQEPMDLCQLYMFDSKSEAWWRWEKQWNRATYVPPAQGVYTVLGHDKPTTATKVAIKELWPNVSQ